MSAPSLPIDGVNASNGTSCGSADGLVALVVGPHRRESRLAGSAFRNAGVLGELRQQGHAGAEHLLPDRLRQRALALCWAKDLGKNRFEVAAKAEPA